MKVLAIDPSSTCVGYAVLTSATQLLDAGRLTPARSRDDPNTRIRSMAADLRAVLLEHPDAQVVIEDTSGKVARHGRARGMNGAGMAIYGKALGYLIRVVEETAECEPELVLENVWTRGASKAKRTARVQAQFPAYTPAADPGGDVADAIGLAVWWILTTGAAARVARTLQTQGN